MKTTGAFILVIGLLIIIFTTFGVLQERIMGSQLLRMTPHIFHSQIWQPLVGAIVVMIGVLIITGQRKRRVNLPM